MVRLALTMTAGLSTSFAYLFYIQLGLDQLIAFPLARIATMVLGVLLEIGVYKPMRSRKATDLTLLIASLGLYIVLQNIISMVWGDDTKTMRTGEVVKGHEFLGARIIILETHQPSTCRSFAFETLLS